MALGAPPAGADQLGAGGFKGGVADGLRLAGCCRAGAQQHQLLLVSASVSS